MELKPRKPSRMPMDFREPPPAMESKAEHWQAWWEDYDSWDGFLPYDSLDIAMHSSMSYYVSEEYGWSYGDPPDEAPETSFSWEFEHGRWRLFDGEQGTGVQLYKIRIYGKKEEL